MESPEPARTENEQPLDGKEPVRVRFRPCSGKLNDGSERVIGRNTIVTVRIKANGISVEDFIRELGKTVVWGSRQELELGSYLERKKYRRITTAPQLFEAIVHGRRGTGEPEITIFAEIIDGSEDSPVGFVRSQAADAINDLAFLADSEPVRNVRDFGPNSLNPPEDFGSGQAEGFIDWNKVDIDLPTDIAPQIFSESKLAKLLGIRLPNDKKTLPPPPPEQSVPPEERGDDYHDEVDKLFEQGGDVVDDGNEEEMRAVYDKDDPDISVGTFWSSMEELKMAFRSYAVKKEFQGKTAWTDKNRFTAKCRGSENAEDGSENAEDAGHSEDFVIADSSEDGEDFVIADDQHDVPIVVLVEKYRRKRKRVKECEVSALYGRDV